MRVMSHAHAHRHTYMNSQTRTVLSKHFSELLITPSWSVCLVAISVPRFCHTQSLKQAHAWSSEVGWARPPGDHHFCSWSTNGATPPPLSVYVAGCIFYLFAVTSWADLSFRPEIRISVKFITGQKERKGVYSDSTQQVTITDSAAYVSYKVKANT
jgi:hypothetical protein